MPVRSNDPIKTVYFAIVIQAIKDYYKHKNEPTHEISIEAIRWIIDGNEMFDLCAFAMGKEPIALKEMLLGKMIRISHGEKLKIYKL